MKRHIYECLILSFLLFTCHISYSQDWKVKAVSETGNFIDVKAIDANGDMYDVIASTKGGDERLLDVKVKKGNSFLSVKLISSNDYYIPIKALNSEGEVLEIKAVDVTGKMYDVKGISRSGNTIRISAVTESEEFMAILAISPQGMARDVAGVKFQDEDVEMEIGAIDVIAHVKAMPTIKVHTEEPIWNIRAIGSDGANLELCALDENGKENEIKALSLGGSFYMLNVKALIGKEKVSVKLVNEEKGKLLMAIDFSGQKYPVKAKAVDGTYYDIFGGDYIGNTIDIKAIGKDGIEYKIKAISPGGDIYDVLGIKLNHDDREGYIKGLEESFSFHAHVKAMPPIQ